MFKNAYHNNEQAKDFDKLHNPIRDIALAYSEMEEKDSAIYYYKQACQLAKKSGNQAKENTLLNELGGYYFNINESELAISTLRACNNELANAIPNYIGWGLFYQHFNQPDSAKYFYQKSLETKGTIYMTSSAYFHLAELEEADGNYKEAFRLLRIHQQWQDSIKKITNTETAQRMHGMYNYQRTENENQKLKEANTRKELWLYQIAIVVILIVAAGIWYRRYQKQKRQQLIHAEKRISDAKEKQYAKSLERINKNEQLIGNLKLELLQTKKEKQALMEAQVKSLEAINSQIRSQQEEKELKIKELRQSDIYKRFHTESMGEIDLEGEAWIELQQALDDTYDNFTGQLYTLYPTLSPIELRICCLIKIEVKVTDISRLIGRSKAAISTARGKLYEKMQGIKGTPEMLDALLMEL